MYGLGVQIFIKLPLLLEVATPKPCGVLVHDQKRQFWLLKYKKNYLQPNFKYE
jgi:hypothetical protein